MLIKNSVENDINSCAVCKEVCAGFHGKKMRTFYQLRNTEGRKKGDNPTESGEIEKYL